MEKGTTEFPTVDGLFFLNLYLIIILTTGVCDCCDGADELGSLHGTICNDTCDDVLLSQRNLALVWHKNVLQGLEMKRKFQAAHQSKQVNKKS